MNAYKIIKYVRYIVCTILFSTLSTAIVEAKEDLSHSVSIQVGGAYNNITHYYMRGDNPDSRRLDKLSTLSLRYSFAHSPQSRIGRAYPTTYQGIGIIANSFFAHKSLGTPLAVYLFQGCNILDFSNSFSLGYEWNIGLSWGWVPNDAHSAYCNAMISVMLPIKWKISPQCELSIAPLYNHFSNGDTSFPNHGIDSFGARIGFTYHFEPQKVSAPGFDFFAPTLEADAKFKERTSWDIVFYGGWRADRFTSNGKFILINEPIPNWGVQINPLYHFNHYFSLGVSLDIFTDMSANLYDAVLDNENNLISYSRPPLWQQTAIGVSLRGEIRMPIFAVGVGVGANIIQHGYDMQRLYSIFSLKAFVGKRTFLYLGYRLSTLKYTRNVMYGFGFRF